jgi:PAS domain S-box-containing protein
VARPVTVTHRHRNAEGELRHSELVASPLWGECGELLGIVESIRDVTERVRARAQIVRAKQDWEETFDSIADLIFIVDPDYHIVRVNRALAERLGMEPKDAVGLCCYQAIHGTDRPPPYCRQSQFSGEEGLQAQEMFDERLGGHFLVNTSPLRSADGALRGSVHVARDISDLKRAEEALRRERDRAQRYLNIAGVILITIDADEKVRLINKKGCEVLGSASDEVLGTNWFDRFVPEPDRERTRQAFRKLMGGEIEPVEYFENPVLTRKGELRSIAWHNTVLRGAEGRIVGTLSSGEDITERKHLERQVQHAQKLESLGVMAGGIAHDFNNLLMGILGYADLALTTLPGEAAARQQIEKVVQVASRAAELTGQMLAYSGKGPFLVGPLNLNRLAEDMIELLHTSISKKALLDWGLSEGLPLIEGDASQIRQVLMNLITNASEALGDHSGVITLRTGVMAADRSYLERAYLGDEAKEGEYVYLEVSDTGCGMTEDIRQKIFDPFFSTKFTGRGLGLAAVLGIVRGHKGVLTVDSEPGHGATFRLLFPGSEAIPAEQKPDRDRVAEMPLATGILVVDDEEDVLYIAKKALSARGFDVLTASDGREAVEIYRRNRDRISLVILDLTMPRMSGEEAFREMRRLRGDVRVLLSSGYSEQEATDRFRGDSPVGFIQKPYRPARLIEKVGEVLRS